MNDDDDELRLVYPFVVCASEGGPYDDESFVAGVQFGQLMERLNHVSGWEQATVLTTIRDTLEAQVDLLAMDAGFVVRVEEYHEGWRSISLTSAGGVQETEGTDE